MLNGDLMNQHPLDSISVIDRYKNNDGDDIEKFRRFKDIEEKNKNRIKAERRR